MKAETNKKTGQSVLYGASCSAASGVSVERLSPSLITLLEPDVAGALSTSREW